MFNEDRQQIQCPWLWMFTNTFLFSSIFESYIWTLSAILVGNIDGKTTLCCWHVTAVPKMNICRQSEISFGLPRPIGHNSRFSETGVIIGVSEKYTTEIGSWFIHKTVSCRKLLISCRYKKHFLKETVFWLHKPSTSRDNIPKTVCPIVLKYSLHRNVADIYIISKI